MKKKTNKKTLKLTAADLEYVQSLKKSTEQLMIEIGNLEFQKVGLIEQIRILRDRLSETMREITLSYNLPKEKKFEIDIETGEIIEKI